MVDRRLGGKFLLLIFESMGHLQRKYLSGVLGIEYDQLERIVQGRYEKDKSPAAMMGNIVKDTDRIETAENIAVPLVAWDF